MEKCYYGCLHDADELKKSSSGGFATSIAKYAIKNQAVVYGVSYTSDFKGAEYIRASSNEDLIKMIGSKYICANNSQIIKAGGIIDDLTSGKKVVLIGLPCNIAGALSVIHSKGLKTDNLITIDLICGGATPSEVGKQYIEYIEKKHKSNVIDFSVRYKNPNWTPPYLRAVFENGDVFCKPFYETEYGFAFEHMKKESCYSCRFKGNNHPSDITVGDGWGLEKSAPGYNRLGVSVAFVHTEAGDNLLKKLTDIDLFEVDSDKMKQSNPRYSTPKPRSEKSKKFTSDYRKYGLIKSCKKSYSLKKRDIDAMPEGLLKSIKSIKHIIRK
ncbi:MAG: Coenzyme F420 hydrogenase/dehydrogenase, beta subunit C-terminal domain [Oscillospiraceae bacterium]|nr:Coenzyme F420 hydrogenase/dehydrogenase, beta subunit C-terminal domain [Oscillospiraceae bacterium]